MRENKEKTVDYFDSINKYGDSCLSNTGVLSFMVSHALFILLKSDSTLLISCCSACLFMSATDILN
jgi:hypothetical protein